ncbi:MFS transporter [Embleya scabrispora]|uniref:MFS transporter n=1 Tax=Embleya scabrispora TaxID=159449 RepID=UPI0003A8AAF3|nr:MFS transporter [Embleya scabrispora]MYS78949.1 MFS transporter [Streptomyces sp. SID5474]
MPTTPRSTASSAAHSPPTSTVARPALTVVLACLGVFASYVPIGGVAVSLPTIQRGLDASTSDLQWISDIFILPMAALILTFGLIGDLYGRKKAFLAGLVLLGAGSATNLTAHGVTQVWVGQALSGAGGAALLTSSLALISHAYPDFRARAKAISAWAASLGLGMSLGPLLSGAILEQTSWRWIFAPIVVVCLVGVAVAAVLLEDSRSPHGRAIDVPGQIAGIIAITGLIYGVIEGGTTGWTDGPVLVAFALAILGLAAFIVIEHRSATPMLSLKLFSSRTFTGAGVVTMITMFGLVGIVFSLSLFFGNVQHLSALDIAYRFLLINGLTVVIGPIVGRLMGRIPSGALLTVGLVVTGIGMLTLNTLEPDTGFAALVGPLVIIGVGFAFVMTPITSVAVSSVPHHLAGMAGAGNNTLRQLGGALGPAVLGAVLTNRIAAALPDNLTTSGLAPADREHVTSAVSDEGLSAAGHLGLAPEATGRALSAVGDSFADALHLCMTIAGLGMFVAAGVTVVMIGVRRPKTPAGAPAARIPAQPPASAPLADSTRA